MPSAAELPSFEASNTETPTPLNPLGAKGIGESGTIGSTPAVQNAVVDALSHLGRPPHRHAARLAAVWQAIQDARAATTRLMEPFAAPLLRLTVEQHRRIVAHCYFGLPDEACGLLAGPVVGSARRPGLVTEVYPAVNADASVADLHRRRARLPPRVA